MVQLSSITSVLMRFLGTVKRITVAGVRRLHVTLRYIPLSLPTSMKCQKLGQIQERYVFPGARRRRGYISNNEACIPGWRIIRSTNPEYQLPSLLFHKAFTLFTTHSNHLLDSTTTHWAAPSEAENMLPLLSRITCVLSSPWQAGIFSPLSSLAWAFLTVFWGLTASLPLIKYWVYTFACWQKGTVRNQISLTFHNCWHSWWKSSSPSGLVSQSTEIHNVFSTWSHYITPHHHKCKIIPYWPPGKVITCGHPLR